MNPLKMNPSKMNRLYLFALVVLMCIALVPAQPPQFSASITEGLQISYPKFEVLAKDQPYNLSVHVFNVSDGVEIIDASCDIELYNKTGFHILELNLIPLSDEYNIFITSENFSKIGEYSYNVYCNTSTQGGFIDGSLYVTNTGTIPEISDAIMYGILLSLLVFFIILMFVAHFRDTSELGRFWWFSFMWIPIWALLFVSWSMANDFLTSQRAIVGILWYGWLIVGIMYPFYLLGLTLYVFYWIYKQQEVQRLITRGFDVNEANAKVWGGTKHGF